MALDFNASGDKLTTPTFVVPTAVTYAAWLKDVDGVASTGPRILENTTPTTRWFLDTSSSEIVYQRLFSTTAEWRCSYAGVDFSSWHHVAVTHDASSAANDPIFYIDGVQKSLTLDSNTSGSVNTTSNVMNIGNRPTNARQCGTLEYVGIYNAVLSQANIQSLLTTAHFASNRFANWTLTPDGSTFADLSGNSLTATKAGSPVFVATGPSLAGPGAAVDFTSTVTLQAAPKTDILTSVLFNITSIFDVVGAQGAPYPGGPGAGVGGTSRSSRTAIIIRRR